MNKYQQSQEHIRVTPEMKDRLLRSVNEEHNAPPAKVPVSFKRRIQRLSAMAACLAVVIGGTYFFLQNTRDSGQLPITLERIQEDAHFDLYVPSALPTGYALSDYSVSENTVSISYKNSDAEINYFMAESMAGVSSTDAVNTTDLQNRSDYFGPITYAAVSDIVVMLYGDNDEYRYAEWYCEGYDFGLTFSKPLSESDVVSIVKSVARYQ